MITDMQKIREATIYKAGNGGAAISIPKVFIDDNDLLNRNRIAIYRTKIEGKDALIIIPIDKEQTEPEKTAAEISSAI